MSRFTFSKLPLLEACAPAGVLPWTESESEAARRGTVLHDFLYNVRALGRDAALERVPADMREAAADWDLDGLPTDAKAFAGEVAFAIDLDAGTARELGRNIGRDYAAAGAQPHEVVGAADALSLVGSTAVRADELKTGWRYVPPPKRNLQVRAQLAAAALAYGRDDGIGVVHHRREDNSGWTERAIFDTFDHAETLDRIRQVRARVEGSRSEVMRFREGEWCATCPAISSCPAKMALVRQLVENESDQVVEAFRATLAPETAGEAFQKLEAIEALVDRLKKVLREYAAQTPIPLGDGRFYGMTSSKRDSLDGRTVWLLVEEEMGREAAWDAVELKGTKAALERLVKKAIAGTGKKVSHEMKRLLAELERRDGIHTKHLDTVKVYSEKKGKRDAGDEAA